MGAGDTDWVHLGIGAQGNARLVISSRGGKSMAAVGEDPGSSGGVEARLAGTESRTANFPVDRPFRANLDWAAHNIPRRLSRIGSRPG